MKKLLQYFSKPKEKKPSKWYLATPKHPNDGSLQPPVYTLLECDDPGYAHIRLHAYKDPSTIERYERDEKFWPMRKSFLGRHWSDEYNMKEISYEEAFTILL